MLRGKVREETPLRAVAWDAIRRGLHTDYCNAI